MEQRGVVLLAALRQHHQHHPVGHPDRRAEGARHLARPRLHVQLHVGLAVEVDAEPGQRLAQRRQRASGREAGVELGRAHQPRQVGRARLVERHAQPAAQLAVELVRVQRLRVRQERLGAGGQPGRVEPEPFVQRQHRGRAQLGRQHPLALRELGQHRVQVALGDLAAAPVQLSPAGRVGLVQEQRAHLPVGHLPAVERHRQAGLEVGRLVGQLLGAVTHVGLGREPLQLGGGVHRGQLQRALQRGEVGVAVVHPGHLHGRLEAGAVAVVLGQRLRRHVLEVVTVGDEVDGHARSTTGEAMPALARDQELELVIDSLAYGGRGVARHGELVVFVARALPGDRVRARVTKFKRRYAEARAVELLEAGPGRVTARCEHFGVCGGCAWQDLDYAEQLRAQAGAGGPTPWSGWGGWRATTWRRSSRPARSGATATSSSTRGRRRPTAPALGFHVAGRWDRLMAVNTCHIASPVSNELRRAFERWAREQGLQAYDQRSGAGFLRHLVVREGRNTGQLLAMLVTAPGAVPALERLQRQLPDGVVGVRARRQRRRGRGHGRAGDDARCSERDEFERADRCGLDAASCRPVRSCRPTPRCATCCTGMPWSRPSCAPTTSPGTSTAAPARSGCWRRPTCERVVGVEISLRSRSQRA